MLRRCTSTWARETGCTYRAGWCRAATRREDGKRRYKTEIHAQEVVFLDSRNGGREGDNGSEAEEETDASPF